MPSLRGEDGSYIGADSQGNVDAIGLDGSVIWSVPTQQFSYSTPTPLYATADGGAIVTTTTQCPPNIVEPFPPSCTPYLGTLYTLDQNGNVTAQAPDTGGVISWTGNWYDPPVSGGSLSNVPGPVIVNYADGDAVQKGGSPAGVGAFTHSLQKLYRSQIASIAQGYATAASTLWVPYDVTNYTGQRSPSVKSYIKDTCNIFVGDVLDMAQRAVTHLLNGDTNYVPSPFDLVNPLPSISVLSVPNPDYLAAPQLYHVSLTHPSQTGWVYIGSRDWATWSFYFNQPFPLPGQGPVKGQVSGGAGCWAPVPGGPARAQPGDVMAEYAYGGTVHHTAINVVPGPTGQVASTSGIGQTYRDTVAQSNWGYRTSWSTQYGYSGLEQDVTARRWLCY